MTRDSIMHVFEELDFMERDVFKNHPFFKKFFSNNPTAAMERMPRQDAGFNIHNYVGNKWSYYHTALLISGANNAAAIPLSVDVSPQAFLSHNTLSVRDQLEHITLENVASEQVLLYPNAVYVFVRRDAAIGRGRIPVNTAVIDGLVMREGTISIVQDIDGVVPNIAQNTTIVPNHVSVTIRLNGFNVGAVHRLNPATTTTLLFSAALDTDVDPALIGNARSAIIIKLEGKFGVRNTDQNRLIELVPANNAVANDNAWDCGLSQYIAAIRSAVNAGYFFRVEDYIRRLLMARMNAMVVDWGHLLQMTKI